MNHSEYEFTYRQDGDGSRRLRWGLDAHNAPSEEVQALLDSDSPAADLWQIAGSCYAVDHDAPRPPLTRWRTGGSEWSRELTVCLPVRNEGFWEEQRGLLEELLRWTTGDEWTLRFTTGAAASGAYQAPAFNDPPVTALFSGGLDSTAGVALELERNPRSPLRLVTVATNTRQKGLRRRLLEGLASFPESGGGIDSTLFHLNMCKRRPRETSGRSRGFVFLSAAVATAVAYDGDLIRVYENGTGALNLACSRGQVGAQAARPVHPRTLKLMERLAHAVAGRRIRIENPYVDTTKGELVAQVPERYDGLLRQTVSCDTGFSRRAADRHCGKCTSCLLRRQSIVTAGRDWPVPEPREGPATKNTHPRAMLWQVHRLRHALRPRPSWERLVQEFPDVVCVPGAFDPATRRELLGLLSRYAQEWSEDQLPAILGDVFDSGDNL